MSRVPRRREASDLVCAICMPDGKREKDGRARNSSARRLIGERASKAREKAERMRDEIKREEGSRTENVMHLFPNPYPSSSSSLHSLLLLFVVLFVVIPYFPSLLVNLHPPFYLCVFPSFPSFPSFATLSRLLTIKKTHTHTHTIHQLRHPLSFHLSSFRVRTKRQSLLALLSSRGAASCTLLSLQPDLPSRTHLIIMPRKHSSFSPLSPSFLLTTLSPLSHLSLFSFQYHSSASL